jgi:hypothetical protein
MGFLDVHDEVNRLLTKAGRLRHAALATSMLHYRSLLLRVARELEAKAAALEIRREAAGGLIRLSAGPSVLAPQCWPLSAGPSVLAPQCWVEK